MTVKKPESIHHTRGLSDRMKINKYKENIKKIKKPNIKNLNFK